MQSAQSLGDFPTLSMLGHRLKSAALTVGAMRFADLCHALEKENPDGKLEYTENIVEEMLTLFEQIEQRVGYLLTTHRV
jgi:two-component system sensor histidine kinase/response regulator